MSISDYIVVFAPSSEEDEIQITETSYYVFNEELRNFGEFNETFDISDASRLTLWEADIICETYGGYITEV